MTISLLGESVLCPPVSPDMMSPMKKLLAIVVLGLLCSGNLFANNHFKVELENCGKMSSSGASRAAAGYFIDVENRSTTAYKIIRVNFYTKDNQQMSSITKFEILGSFQQTSLFILQKKMIHSMLHKIIITCEKF
jgi:hypothetical protein